MDASQTQLNNFFFFAKSMVYPIVNFYAASKKAEKDLYEVNQ